MGVLALTNNMIVFTFFQSKITLSFAFPKMLVGICGKFSRIRWEKCCIMGVIR